METETEHRIRYYEAAKDSAMLATWARAHGSRFEPHLCPPLGLVIQAAGEDVACLFLHLSPAAGVGFIDSLLARPGRTMAQSAAAFAHGLRALREVAARHGTGVLLAHAPEGLARFATPMGFLRGAQGLVQLWTLTH